MTVIANETTQQSHRTRNFSFNRAFRFPLSVFRFYHQLSDLNDETGNPPIPNKSPTTKFSKA